MSMNRRDWIVSAGSVMALSNVPTLAAYARKQTHWYSKAIVIDGLSSFSDPYAPEEQMRLSDRLKAELRQTGVSAINVTVGGVGNDLNVWDQGLAAIKNYDEVIEANPDFLVKVSTAADIRAAKATNKFGLIYGTQDSSMIGTTLDRLAELKAKGIRIVQLTYNLRNLSGDGALEPDNAGLSKLGHATINRIESEKLILDLSHGGAKTIEQAIAAATRPLSINHTGCRDLFDHPRNIYDSAMRAVADKGGVVGIYFMPFLAAGSKPTKDDLIRHINHARNICGEEHVSLGTDGNQLPIPINEATWQRAREMHEFRSANGFAAPGEGPDILTIVHDYNRLDRFQSLVEDLAKAGWKRSQLEKLLGGNLLRLYAEIWGA
ncbi:MAG: membrane dipeptidase [Sphingorhabdus sp.]|uniref:dipeptidase n=1 Tax=Sphingorhabdus sp. TaxID=1902408 RepID=UPI003C9046A7